MGDGMAGGDFFMALAGLKDEYESRARNVLKTKSKPPFLQKNYIAIMWDVFSSLSRFKFGYFSHYINMFE